MFNGLIVDFGEWCICVVKLNFLKIWFFFCFINVCILFVFGFKVIEVDWIMVLFEVFVGNNVLFW